MFISGYFNLLNDALLNPYHVTSSRDVNITRVRNWRSRDTSSACIHVMRGRSHQDGRRAAHTSVHATDEKTSDLRKKSSFEAESCFDQTSLNRFRNYKNLDFYVNIDNSHFHSTDESSVMAQNHLNRLPITL